jgi:hypothetical protein
VKNNENADSPMSAIESTPAPFRLPEKIADPPSSKSH